MRVLNNTSRWLSVCIAIFIAAVFNVPASAQDYPDKPIRLVIPWPAGGLVDIAGRTAAKVLQPSLKQTIVVENKLGAGGILGADSVAKAPADGYTLLLTTSALSINAVLRTKMPFDMSNDLAPIALIAWAPSVLVASPLLKVASVQELIALAKTKPGKLTYASAGVGSPAHLSAELFKTLAGIDLLHVPYKGAPQAMTDVIAGEVDLLFANATVAIPQIKANKIRALAVTSAKPYAGLPDLPTMAQAGVLKFEADQWLGIFAPSGTPEAILTLLHREIGKALVNGEVRTTLEQNGMTTAVLASRNDFKNFLVQDKEKWAGVVSAANIPKE
ncbi:MAG: tripartite tricarboxylate transporter substrate binding protein [Burkholderiaceae bacterium]|nr:tripartite tricarboxylate transporter substrate binding protein [Burkholderiaceae bacterium]